jgi:phage FluMu protein Com
MQLRCTYCQTMFAISREDMLAALEHMEENKQVYYDAHCPKCRRANRVERARMERFFPDWKKAIKVMEKESTAAESTEAVKDAAAPKAAAQAEKKNAAKASSPKGKPSGKKKR